MVRVPEICVASIASRSKGVQFQCLVIGWQSPFHQLPVMEWWQHGGYLVTDAYVACVSVGIVKLQLLEELSQGGTQTSHLC
jgi:hypothetical protein